MKITRSIVMTITVLFLIVACSPKSELQKKIDETFEIVSIDIPFDKEKTSSVSILDLKDDYVYYTEFTGGSFPSGVYENKIYRMNINTEEVEELFETSNSESIYSLAASNSGLYYITYEPDMLGEEIKYKLYLANDKDHEMVGKGQFNSLSLGPEFILYNDEVHMMTYGPFESNSFKDIKEASVSILNLESREVLVQLEDAVEDFLPSEERNSGTSGLYSSKNNESIIFSSNQTKDNQYISNMYVYNNDELNNYTVKDHFTFNFIEIKDHIVYGSSDEASSTWLGVTNYKDSNLIGSHNYSFLKIRDFKNDEIDGALVSIQPDYQLVLDGIEKEGMKFGFMQISDGNAFFEEIDLFDQKGSIIHLVNEVISLDDSIDDSYVRIQIIKDK